MARARRETTARIASQGVGGTYAIHCEVHLHQRRGRSVHMSSADATKRPDTGPAHATFALGR